MPERRQEDEAGHQGEDEDQDADGDVEVPHEEGAFQVLVGVVGGAPALPVQGKPPPQGRDRFASSSIFYRPAHSDNTNNLLLPGPDPVCSCGGGVERDAKRYACSVV